MDTYKVELMVVVFLMVLNVEVGFASRTLLTGTEHAYGGEHGLGGQGLGGGIGGLGGGIGGLGGGYGFGGPGCYEGGYGRFRHHHNGCGCHNGYGYGQGGSIGSGEGYGYGGGKGGGIGHGAGVKDGIDHVDAGITATTKEHVINTDVGATGASKHADGTKHAP